jgi:hypothetical protein
MKFQKLIFFLRNRPIFFLNFYFKSILQKDDLRFLTKCDFLFFCGDNDRGIKFKGKRYSVLIDSIIEDLKKKNLKCITIAKPWSFFTGKKGYNFPININKPYFFFRLKKIINSIFFFKLFSIRQNIFDKILAETDAKVLFGIGPINKNFIKSAKKSGVYVVEILHGMGTPILPPLWLESSSINYLPDLILSLDKLSTKTFRKFSNKKKFLVETIMHPFFKKFINNNKKTIPKEWRITKEVYKNYRKEILISLSTCYAGDHGPYKFENILSNGLFYDELGELIKERKDIFWRFRLHPVMITTQDIKLIKYINNFVSINKNSEWKSSSKLPFWSVASRCHGNIQMFSSSAYDAALIGLRSLSLCPTLLPGGIYQDFFKDLVREGYLKKIKINKQKISKWVDNVDLIKPRYLVYSKHEIQYKIENILLKAKLNN